MTTLTHDCLKACDVPGSLMRNRILRDTVRRLSVTGERGIAEFVSRGETLAAMDEFRIAQKFSSHLSEAERRGLGYLQMSSVVTEIETYACQTTGGLMLVANGEVCGYAVNESVARQLVEDSAPVGTRLMVVDPEVSLYWRWEGVDFFVSEAGITQGVHCGAWRFALSVAARFVEGNDLSLVLKSEDGKVVLDGKAGIQSVTLHCDSPRIPRQLTNLIRLALLLSAVNVTEV